MGRHGSMEPPLLLGSHENQNAKNENWAKLVFSILAVITITIVGLALGSSQVYEVLITEHKYSGRTQSQGSEIAVSDKGVVAADDARCSEVGASILRKGGHAVDAAVATALCVGVVNPMASGIGGGAFMVVRSASSAEALAFDMRETAPSAASQNRYKNNPKTKLAGALSMGVPGELAGLHEAWKKYGRLPWRTIFEPAIELAKNGFEVLPYLGQYIVQIREDNHGGSRLKTSVCTKWDDLADRRHMLQCGISTKLGGVAEQGPQAFYNGTVGEKLVKDVREAGGILTMEDLRNYKVRVTDPLQVDVMGYRVVGMPPPSSGTVGLALIMNILNSSGSFNAVEGSLGLHRLIEAMKHMLAIRMNLGDPAFIDVDKYISDMTSPSFAEKISQKINDNTTFSPEYYMNRWNQLQDNGTSHFCIVDAERNAVSMTTTVNYPFGAGLLSPSTGVVLNNEMGDFSTPEVHPDELPPAPANFIQPGKRPLSSMTPLIILKGNQVKGVIGGSGGIAIIPAVSQVFLNHFVLGMDPLSAVQSPRVHHKLVPNVVWYENLTAIDGEHIELQEERKDFLEERGHQLKPTGIAATCQLIVQNFEDSVVLGRKMGKNSVDNDFYGILTAVSDPRKDGRPAAM